MEVKNFQAGLRVLAVDDNPTSLLLLKRQIMFCNYNNVTTVTNVSTTLDMLRERKDRDDQFDLVISEVFMVDGIDGFKLLKHISLEMMDIPVIMLSMNNEKDTMMKGIMHGACDYLEKPVRLEQLKNIWTHVVRKSMNAPRNKISNGNDVAAQKLKSRDGKNGEKDGANHTRGHSRKNKKDGNGAKEDKDTLTQKKQKVMWAGQLHHQFLEAINQIGTDKVVPKKILEVMNVDGLSRQSIASHLQKYRIHLKELTEGTLRPSDPFINQSRAWMSNMSVPESSQHHQELGSRYMPSLPLVGASSSSNPFPRMNSPSAFGAHSVLHTQSVQDMSSLGNLGMEPVTHCVNLPGDASRFISSSSSFATATIGGFSSGSQCLLSAPSRSSSANISNGVVFNTSMHFSSGTSNISPLAMSMRFPSSSRSCTSYASTLCAKMLDASRGIPFDAENFFEEITDGEVPVPAPSSHLPLQSPELASHSSVQIQTSSIGPTQENSIMINMIARFVASSSQAPTFGNTYANQIAGLMGTTTPMAGFSEEFAVPPFNFGSSTSSTVMPTGCSALGSSSTIRPTLSNLQIGSSVMPAQMPNAGGASTTGNLHEGGTADQQAVGGQVNSSNELPAGTSSGTGNATTDDMDDFFADFDLEFL